jgi:tRNA wybutosine-synthesizing protein 1
LDQFKSWSARVIRSISLPSTSIGREEDSEMEEEEDYEEEDEEQEEDSVVDMEDIGGAAPRKKDPQSSSRPQDASGPPQMLTPLVRSSLTKQGYKLIGSHSGVKMCRWTKSMMRGRGGCYKHAFYGIESHRCMEHTPSLACANKCVFCWRHHSNPVGKTWKWEMDDPQSIVTQAIKLHQGMIKEYAGGESMYDTETPC